MKGQEDHTGAKMGNPCLTLLIYTLHPQKRTLLLLQNHLICLLCLLIKVHAFKSSIEQRPVVCKLGPKFSHQVGLVTKLHLTLCDTMDCSPPGSFLCQWNSPGKNTGVRSHSIVQGIFQPRDQTWVSCIARRFFTILATREAPITREAL